MTERPIRIGISSSLLGEAVRFARAIDEHRQVIAGTHVAVFNGMRHRPRLPKVLSSACWSQSAGDPVGWKVRESIKPETSHSSSPGSIWSRRNATRWRSVAWSSVAFPHPTSRLASSPCVRSRSHPRHSWLASVRQGTWNRSELKGGRFSQFAFARRSGGALT